MFVSFICHYIGMWITIDIITQSIIRNDQGVILGCLLSTGYGLCCLLTTALIGSHSCFFLYYSSKRNLISTDFFHDNYGKLFFNCTFKTSQIYRKVEKILSQVPLYHTLCHICFLSRSFHIIHLHICSTYRRFAELIKYYTHHDD